MGEGKRDKKLESINKKLESIKSSAHVSISCLKQK